ncbi:MAG: hypothetical protein FJZ80_08450 [Bacteroidetes bacterium]|nr:hypothetical protein [Bacteroidota bacterium]MBM3424087.1 hypothetical protein [Bacteroidota bacterium]
MNLKISIFFLFICSFGFSQELPKSISIHFTQYLEIHTLSELPLDSALLYSEERTEETTNCIYVLDFELDECRVYFEDSLVGKAPILDIQNFSTPGKRSTSEWDFICKLGDAADDTEVRVSIEDQRFLYYYGWNHGPRVISKPLSSEIIASY